MVSLELAGYHDDPVEAATRFVRGGMALLRGFASFRDLARCPGAMMSA